MQIICPECQFAREVNEDKVPAKSQVATCPKCKTKFKFRDLPEEEIVQEDTPASAPVSTPIPTPPPAEPKQTFPTLTAPGEDPKDELWDKLGDMTPPKEKQTKLPTPHSDQRQESVEDQQIQSADQQPIEGWTGNFNSDFPDPMQDDFTDEEDTTPMQILPPFEQLDRYGFFNGLYMTIKLALTSPRLFFSVMPVGGGLAKPLTFAILVTMIQALAQLIWGAAGLTPGIGINNQEIVTTAFDVSGGMFELMLTPAIVAVTIFMVTGLNHLLLILLKADAKGFEGTFRALSYGYTPIVISIFPMPTFGIMATFMSIYAIWSLALTAIGLKYIHKTSYTKVIPAMILALLILIMIASMAMLQAQLPAI